jgi:hypothetical protein
LTTLRLLLYGMIFGRNLLGINWGLIKAKNKEQGSGT